MKKDTTNTIKDKLIPVGTSPTVFYMPFVGDVPAGFPSLASDYMEQPIDLHEKLIEHPSATFIMRVTGDSMIDAHMPPGCLLIVDRALTPRSGCIVVAVVNGEFTVKRLEKKMGKIRLLPENPKYRPIEIEGGMECFVWGVVRHIIIDSKTV